MSTQTKKNVVKVSIIGGIILLLGYIAIDYGIVWAYNLSTPVCGIECKQKTPHYQIMN